MITIEEIEVAINSNRRNMAIINEFLCPYSLVSIINDYHSTDDLYDEIYDYINSQIVIGYAEAIEFLSKNDPSLLDSIGLAQTLGLDLKNLDSEKLASLLLQEMLKEAVFCYLIPKLGIKLVD